MAAYGVDTLDPRVSTRRVAVLLDQLPPQYRSPGEVWSPEAHLLALLVDHVAQLTWVTLKAHGAKTVPRPKPLPRPGQARQQVNAAPAHAGPSPGHESPGGTKHSSWASAIQALAGMQGVKVRGS